LLYQTDPGDCYTRQTRVIAIPDRPGWLLYQTDPGYDRSRYQ